MVVQAGTVILAEEDAPPLARTMSSFSRAASLLLPLLLPLRLFCALVPGVQADAGSHKALFVFGDSYADTGNHDPWDSTVNACWRKPYGSTWPGHPSGRFSNGRVLTDFVASHMGIETPLSFRAVQNESRRRHGDVSPVTPLSFRAVQNESRRHGDVSPVKAACARGVNFAYGGSGMFPTFGKQYVTIPAQIHQLRTLVREGLVSLSNSSTALLVVAGNDYSAYGLQHPTKEGLFAFMGKVVSKIVASLEALHRMGVKRLAVTNLEPFGCFPGVSNHSVCNKTENEQSGFHNKLLASHISKLKARLPPEADITILDLERAFSLSLKGPFHHSKSQWDSCCKARGNGGCGVVNARGTPLYRVCSKPHQAFYWDTVHPTDSGWESVASTLFS